MSEQGHHRTVSNALPIGYRFNEFEITGVVGGGGFGIVYRAWDYQLERTIAIKEFMPASLAVRNADLKLALRSGHVSKAFQAGLNSFIQEARLLARFNHPNLLHVLRFWVQNDTAYMGTIFYSGSTLSHFQANHPQAINEQWIRELLPPLMGAINTLHQEGYLHRDISLDNIQIQDDGVPVLLDFGSARRTIGNLADETETMLRPGFAPIEQYTDNNESEQGPWSDIYALGAVLHTLITGSTPPVSVVRSIEENYKPLAERNIQGYGLPLLQAIDKALSLQIEQRPQTMAEFATLLQLSASLPDLMAGSIGSHSGSKLVAVEEPAAEMTEINQSAWQRFRLPVLVVAGVLVGGIAGILLKTKEAPPSPVVEHKNPAPVVIETPLPMLARIYIKLEADEQVKINGKTQELAVSTNGLATLMLPRGDYLFTISDHQQSRQQQITIQQPGVWLINP